MVWPTRYSVYCILNIIICAKFMCTKHLGLHQGNDSREDKIRFYESKGYQDPCVYSCHWYIADLNLNFSLKFEGLGVYQGGECPCPLK